MGRPEEIGAQTVWWLDVLLSVCAHQRGHRLLLAHLPLALALLLAFHRSFPRIAALALNPQPQPQHRKGEEEEEEEEEEGGKRAREAVGLVYELHGALHHGDEEEGLVRALRRVSREQGGVMGDLERLGRHPLVCASE
eukprot:3851233-Rhodomonas_salina.1